MMQHVEQHANICAMSVCLLCYRFESVKQLHIILLVCSLA
jgi:hypothetical protein